MEIQLLLIGKTEKKYLEEGIALFESRLHHYIRYTRTEIMGLKDAKNLSPENQKIKEFALMEKYISQSDYVVLLDERGKSFRSLEFAQFVQGKMNLGLKKILFIVGGPYGFAPEAYQRADFQIALSPMTFSHQMIRLLFTEQLYRAFSILKNEAYHNE